MAHQKMGRDVSIRLALKAPILDPSIQSLNHPGPMAMRAKADPRHGACTVGHCQPPDTGVCKVTRRPSSFFVRLTARQSSAQAGRPLPGSPGRLPGWLGGLLACLLAGWLLGWLAGCLAAWLAGYLAGWLASLAAWFFGGLTCCLPGLLPAWEAPDADTQVCRMVSSSESAARQLDSSLPASE